MMRVFVIFFGLLGYYADAQDSWAFEPHIEFETYSVSEGMIDGKYAIKMYLEESYQSCKANESSRWTPHMVYGWYMYQKVGKKIPLIGHSCYADACETRLKLFVPEDFTNYALDENCDLPNAKEVFTIQPGQSQMFWQMGKGEPLPVQLEDVHPFSFTSKARILLLMQGIEMASFNLNELSQKELIEGVKILAQKSINGSFHLIIDYSHQSNPGSGGHGSCGAGVEVYAAYIKIAQDLTVETFDQIQVESCLSNENNVDVEYDVNHPELGIRKK
ncbi:MULTISPECIES: hypothetical protein [unclassified Imperialibacter]|uniref:hypothetical protein n=1 Tax=unclassified Imperialibacter TaxID=2629706 RepID=UPI00125ECAD4|nr:MULTISPECIES: hypothetical protein [unclassified Imperialibacter]